MYPTITSKAHLKISQSSGDQLLPSIAHAKSELSGWVSGLMVMVGTWKSALKDVHKLQELIEPAHAYR
jgi:hypothetical protein